jgi:cell division protein FtsW (lipid II flippase)
LIRDGGSHFLWRNTTAAGNITGHTTTKGPAMRLDLLRRPHLLGALAATGATGLGLAVMAAAGAPNTYLVINTASLVIGLALLAILRRSGTSPAGPLMLAAAIALLATALFGTTTEGATRWVRIGVVSLQPSLILLPLLVISFVRVRDTAATLAVLIAALALALQPDRAMAGALLAGLAALAVSRRESRVLLALAAAAGAFAVTLARPDTLPAMAFVERVYADAFGYSALAGLALLAGSVLLLLPALAQDRAAGAVFACLWLALLLAAALGNYPTPLLGYGGSGILGYLLCLAVLPGRERHTGGAKLPATTDRRAEPGGEAFVAG